PITLGIFASPKAQDHGQSFHSFRRDQIHPQLIGIILTAFVFLGLRCLSLGSLESLVDLVNHMLVERIVTSCSWRPLIRSNNACVFGWNLTRGLSDGPIAVTLNLLCALHH